MPFVIEQFGVRTASGDPTSAEIPYAVWGVPTSEIARAMVIEASPPTFLVNNVPLFRRQATVEETGPEAHLVHVMYGPIKPPEAQDYKFSFDTTGGRQRITQSLQTVHKYAPPDKTAADHRGAIGVTDHGVEGCEIVVPQFSWTETWQLPIDTYNWTYSQTLKSITGKVNQASFRGFSAGQVLFRGGKGSASNKNPTLIEITYHFDQSDDVTAQTIGDITGVAKSGWQYLWVQYRETDDQTAKAYARRPSAVYVERVYHAASFVALGIGE
ncbi:MAG: hypothetical protein JW818_00140 [Pirellulales bacterium]|nr:hypothetical protein [Pirellulales bacterium]